MFREKDKIVLLGPFRDFKMASIRCAETSRQEVQPYQQGRWDRPCYRSKEGAIAVPS